MKSLVYYANEGLGILRGTSGERVGSFRRAKKIAIGFFGRETANRSAEKLPRLATREQFASGNFILDESEGLDWVGWWKREPVSSKYPFDRFVGG